MTYPDPIRFAELLLSYKKGELDQARRREVEQMISRSPRLQQLARELDDKEQIGKQLDTIASFDMERVLAGVTRPERRRVTPKAWKIAAAIALPVLVGSALLLFGPRQQPQGSAPLAVATAGDEGVLLKLASGEAVGLDTLSQMVDAGQTVLDNVPGALSVTGVDGKAATDNTGEEMYSLEIPHKRTYKVALPDGTEVWLNAASKLRFPKQFTGRERRVELVGEGYFKVAADKTRPFIVTTGSMAVHVTGTSFNVKAYPGESRMQTTLIEGRVSLVDRHGNATAMRPGEQASLDAATGALLIEQVPTEPFTAWKDGMFHFKDASLEEILGTLGRWYGMEVVYLDASEKTAAYTSKMKMYDSIEDVLRKFEKSRSVKINVVANTIVVSKGDKSAVR